MELLAIVAALLSAMAVLTMHVYVRELARERDEGRAEHIARQVEWTKKEERLLDRLMARDLGEFKVLQAQPRPALPVLLTDEDWADHEEKQRKGQAS